MTGTSAGPPTAPSCRRRLQFSLRALLLFVTLWSIALGFVAGHLCALREEKAAARALADRAFLSGPVQGIIRPGPMGRFGYGDVCVIVPELCEDDYILPGWLRRLWRDESRHVKLLSIYDLQQRAMEADVELELLRHIQCQFEEECAKKARRLAAELEGSSPLADDLRREADVERPRQELRDWQTELTRLRQDLRTLVERKEALRFTSRDMVHVGALRGLVVLDLAGADIGDADVGHIKCLNELRVLWLSGTNITDAGLERLLRLENLRHLDLTDTRVSPRWACTHDKDGIAELRRVVCGH